MREQEITGRNQTSGRIGPMARGVEASDALRSPRMLSHTRAGIRMEAQSDGCKKEVVCTYLEHVPKHIFLHFVVMYPYRTTANLDSIQHDVVVLTTNSAIVACIERRQVLVHRGGKWMMSATPLPPARHEFLLLVVTREQRELRNP